MYSGIFLQSVSLNFCLYLLIFLNIKVFSNNNILIIIYLIKNFTKHQLHFDYHIQLTYNILEYLI